MIHVRQSQWETNSSTMNQIIIHSGDRLYGGDTIILHTNLPYKEGDMVNNTAEKVCIVYSMILEIMYEYEHASEEEKHDEKFICIHNGQYFMDMLMSVLKKYNCKLFRDTSEYWNDELFELDNFGLSGISESVLKLFENEETLANFLFDNQSWFVFGITNLWPDNDDLGYTGAKVTDKHKVIFI